MAEFDLTIYCSGCNADIKGNDEAHCLDCIEKLNDDNDEKSKHIQDLEDENSQLEQEIAELKKEVL